MKGCVNTRSLCYTGLEYIIMFVAVEAMLAHRDLFADMSVSLAAAATNLRVNGDAMRRLSSQSSHSDASCSIDYSSASSFGIVRSVVMF